MKTSAPLEAYNAVRKRLAASTESIVFSDPRVTVDPILKIVDAAEPPLRVFLGGAPLSITRQAYEARLAGWEAWADVSMAAED